MNNPSASQLRQIASALLQNTQAGTAPPTITELARRAGITRPTLYRNHPDVVADLLTRIRNQQTAPDRPNQHSTSSDRSPNYGRKTPNFACTSSTTRNTSAD
jgi:hypothetical protein